MRRLAGFLLLTAHWLPLLGQDVPAIQTTPQPTLKQRALRDGHATQLVIGDCGIVPGCDLEHLVAYSSVIAIGTVKKLGSRFGVEEDSVWTDYSFAISSVVKADAAVENVLKVAIGGGKIYIGDAVAETIIRGSPPLISDASYLLFLVPSRFGEADVFWLSFGDLGIYRVTDDGRALCHHGQGVDEGLCGIPIDSLENLIRERLGKSGQQ